MVYIDSDDDDDGSASYGSDNDKWWCLLFVVGKRLLKTVSALLSIMAFYTQVFHSYLQTLVVRCCSIQYNIHDTRMCSLHAIIVYWFECVWNLIHLNKCWLGGRMHSISIVVWDIWVYWSVSLCFICIICHSLLLFYAFAVSCQPHVHPNWRTLELNFLLIHIWFWWFNTNYNNKYSALMVVGGQLCYTNSITNQYGHNILLQSFVHLLLSLLLCKENEMPARRTHTHTQSTFKCDKCLSLSDETIQIVA